MTREEMQKYNDMPTIGYWSDWCGVEIKAIEYGIEDYVVIVVGTFIGKPSMHRVKINYDYARPYIRVMGHKFYLDDCMRVDA